MFGAGDTVAVGVGVEAGEQIRRDTDLDSFPDGRAATAGHDAACLVSTLRTVADP